MSFYRNKRIISWIANTWRRTCSGHHRDRTLFVSFGDKPHRQYDVIKTLDTINQSMEVSFSRLPSALLLVIPSFVTLSSTEKKVKRDELDNKVCYYILITMVENRTMHSSKKRTASSNQLFSRYQKHGAILLGSLFALKHRVDSEVMGKTEPPSILYGKTLKTWWFLPNCFSLPLNCKVIPKR